jgi:hypothetical protein
MRSGFDGITLQTVAITLPPFARAARIDARISVSVEAPSTYRLPSWSAYDATKKAHWIRGRRKRSASPSGVMKDSVSEPQTMDPGPHRGSRKVPTAVVLTTESSPRAWASSRNACWPWGIVCSWQCPASVRRSRAFLVSRCPPMCRFSRPGRQISSSVPGTFPRPPWAPTVIHVRFFGCPVRWKRSRIAQKKIEHRPFPAMPLLKQTASSGIRATACRADRNFGFLSPGGRWSRSWRDQVRRHFAKCASSRARVQTVMVPPDAVGGDSRTNRSGCHLG